MKTRRAIRILLALLLLTIVVLPSVVKAQTAVPDITHQIRQVEVYRNTLEIDDQLYLFSYELEYTFTPSDPVSDTFIFRLMNGAVLLGSTVAYPYEDNGYVRGIASLYFDAASAPAWNGAYTTYFEGNPTISWLDTTATTAMNSAQYYDAPAYTDQTAESNNNPPADDMTLLPAIPLVDDAYYFGSDDLFDILTLTISTAGTPAYNPGVAGWLGVWEYYDGDSWEEVAGLIDNTVGFTAAAGNHDVTWDCPADWYLTIVNAIEAYYIRYRLTEFNTLVIRPLGAQSWTNSVAPPSVNTAVFSLWYDGGTIGATRDRLTTRLRSLAQILETDWGGPADLIEDSATGKVLTVGGEEYFTNTIVDLRSMCPALFYQSMEAAEYEDWILVDDLYVQGDDGTEDVYGNNWFAQTFIAGQNYDMTGARFKFNRTGVAPGDVTVSVKATVAGAPAGADLAVGTTDANVFATTATGEWYDVAFTTDAALTSGTGYAIVVRALTGNAANYVGWRTDTDEGFADGQQYWTLTGAPPWTASAEDMMFLNYAEMGQTPGAGAIHEGQTAGTMFDTSDWANNWVISDIWLTTGIWLILTGLMLFAVAVASDAWDCGTIIIMIMLWHGWRVGFVDTYAFAAYGVICIAGVVYVLAFKKAH